MAYDISGFGLEAQLIASTTFPAGITITEFADDADPVDIGSQQIADKAMSLNGDLVTWSTANHIPITINVIPDSEDDLNLAILLENNRVGRGKSSARDAITLVLNNPGPEGTTTVFTAGRITDGMVTTSTASSGRFKSKPYVFAFENKATS